MAESLERLISIETKEMVISVAIMKEVYDNHTCDFSAEAASNSMGWRGRHGTSAESMSL